MNFNPRIKFARGYTLLLALLIFFTGYQSASADDITHTNNVPLQPTNWSEVLTIPKFNPQLGTLTQVEIVLSSAISGTARYESLDASPADVELALAAQIELDSAPLGIAASVAPLATITETSTAFDGDVNFDGTSGSTFTNLFAVSDAPPIIVSAPSELSAFVGDLVGTEALTFTIDASGTSFGTGAGNLIVGFTTNASSHLSVTYRFDPGLPGIEIEKATNGSDADDANGVDVPILAPGDPILWTYTVTNTGNIPFLFSEVTVVDDQGLPLTFDGTSDDGGDSILSPTESWIYTATGTAPDLSVNPPINVEPGCDPTGAGATRNAYVNMGIVSVSSTISDTDPSHFCNPLLPDIDIEKATNGFDADTPTGPEIELGGVVTWTYVVMNTGNVALANVNVSDDNGSAGDPSDDFAPVFVHGDDNGNGLLDLNELWLYEALGIATVGQYGNISHVSGTDPNGNNPRQDADPSHYYGCPVPIDFDLDPTGHPLDSGTLIADQWANNGIHITTDNPGRHPAMIFDTAAPTGNDDDLGAPNQNFGGPGMGIGGSATGGGPNTAPLGNVLIISEDGDSTDPDDNKGGGTIIFTFDEPLPVEELVVLDIDADENQGAAAAFDSAGSLIAHAPLLPLGNNSVQTVTLQAENVSRLEIVLESSGALKALQFCPR